MCHGLYRHFPTGRHLGCFCLLGITILQIISCGEKDEAGREKRGIHLKSHREWNRSAFSVETQGTPNANLTLSDGSVLRRGLDWEADCKVVSLAVSEGP